jgi:putative ABC transport system permease protein
MAWRETRASRRRLLLFASAIAIGVAALVAISSFSSNLQTAVRREARALLGADLVLGSRTPLSPAVAALLDSTAAAGAPVTRRTITSSMAYVSRIPDRSRLAEVRAVGPGFPFYGSVVTEPAGRWPALATERVAIVDTSLLVTLGARIGDTLELGRGRFVIAATVSDVPGHLTGGVNAFGAQVYVPERLLGETGLIVFGSRVQYEALLKFAAPRDAQRFAQRHAALLERERVRIETADEAESELAAALDNLESFLQFVGLIALLLGGIGVASGITAFLAGKLETIAILRCLGARRPLVFAIYLVQAVGLGLVAALLGASLGIALQFAIPRVLEGVLPVTVEVRLEPRVLAAGLAIGVAVAVLFTLRPLLEVRRVSPLQALRRDYEADTGGRDPWRLAAFGALAIGVFALAMGRHDDPRVGLGFAAAIGLAVGVLTGAARLAAGVARRLTRRAARRGRWPYVVRQGIANLHRPRNQTRAVVTALGFGVSLLAALYLVQANLLRQVLRSTELAHGRPNLVFVDAQTDQAPALRRTIADAGFTVVQAVPMVPMRIAAINGRTAADLLRDTTGRRPAGWTLRREYRSTYRDTLVSSERLVRGSWWRGTGEPARPAGAPPERRRRGGRAAAAPDTFNLYPVSLSTDVAEDLRVGLGDRITWNVSGRMVRTRVVALREVDWARFEPNFFAVFSSAALRERPASWVVLTRVEDAGARARLQRAVAEAFPNVIAFDIATVQRTIERILGRIAIAVRFMASLSLATGALVLLGAVAAGRLQRVREGALLKTLGATRRQLTRILLSEYLALGVLAALVGLGLATLSGWAFTRWVLELPFRLPLVPLLAILLATAALVALIGLTASREVFRRTAMEVLRDV